MRREISQGIIYRNNKGFIEFLIIKRVPEDGGFWQAITGGIDNGESDIGALRRELSEEVGINNPLNISDCLEYYEWGDPKNGKCGRDHIFAVEVSYDTQVVVDKNEHSEFRWLQLEEAVALLKHNGNKRSMYLAANTLKTSEVNSI